MFALSASDTNIRRSTHAERVERLSVVVPIGIIVAVAIVCVVVAVLSSAQRADEVALDAERQLFIARADQPRRTRAARDRDASSTSEAAYRKLRVDFDHRMGADLCRPAAAVRSSITIFVFVADPSDRLLYASLGAAASIRTGSTPFGPISSRCSTCSQAAGSMLDGKALVRRVHDAEAAATASRVRLQTFLGRPAIVAAVAVARRRTRLIRRSRAEPRSLLSVKFSTTMCWPRSPRGCNCATCTGLDEQPPASRRARLRI